LRKILILFVLFAACSKHEIVIIDGQALGTYYRIKYLDLGHDKVNFQKGIDSILKVINSSMSTYIPSSDISKINSGDSTIVVDGHFEKVFQKANLMWYKSQGYFDPTVGAWVNAYGFGPNKKLKKIGLKERDSLMKITGWPRIRLTKEKRVIKDDSNIFIDFNALAKGYTVDQINSYFEKKGSKNHLIDIGGELVSRGKNLITNKMWSVGIEKPSETTLPRKIFDIIELNNEALATSGNYRKYRLDKETNQKYVHSINPLNGRPARSNILSVSVKAEDCMTADAYATSLMVMPLNMGKKLIDDTPNVEALWIISKNQNFVTYSSKNW
tara:strand:- start:360 stop:1340 length:981 start_codon:yes stop_codon:yes gene_type:complete